ncbi:MAG: DUF2089 domain-containing protein [Vulcanimicrobiota bacterium]
MLSNCPVCKHSLEITRFKCPACHTVIEGKFEGCDFCQLPSDDKEFLLIFIYSRGNIKEVEKKMGVSYPTVRSKLDSLIENLGKRKGRLRKDEDLKSKRLKVLQELEDGTIELEEALGKIRKLADGGERK